MTGRGAAGTHEAMCGRFVVAKASSDMLPDLLTGLPDLTPSYNVAPSQTVDVVRQRDDKRSLEQPHWGFVPSWAKDFQKARPKPINARIETVATSGMFRNAFAKYRVLVPASGYIEWTITDTGMQPHYIDDPDAGLAMAGILSFWPDPDKAEEDPEKAGSHGHHHPRHPRGTRRSSGPDADPHRS